MNNRSGSDCRKMESSLPEKVWRILFSIKQYAKLQDVDQSIMAVDAEKGFDHP